MYLDNHIYDNGLGAFSGANQLRICSSLPTNYTEASATFSLGSKVGPTISAPQGGVPNGRQVAVSAIVDGAVATGGTGGFYALIDTVNSRLLAAGAVSSPQALIEGNPFTLSGFTIRIPAPA
jgi:hypothetical protein